MAPPPAHDPNRARRPVRAVGILCVGGVLGLLAVLAGCSDDSEPTGDAATTTGAPQATETARSTFCDDLEGFYAANGAFFVAVSTGAATGADLDELVAAIQGLPRDAPPAIAAEVEVVVASVLGLVDALRPVDLTDLAAVTPLLIESTDDAAVAAADRMDAHARDECGFDPEDAATPG